MDLHRFAPAHAAAVARWPVSLHEVVMWCGEREFPMTEQTIDGWQQGDDTEAYVLKEASGAQVLGYGELWIDAEEDEVELARIIVARDLRGRGLGRALVRGLLARAIEAGFDGVFMRVHSDNNAALRCYRGAGFVPVEADLAATWNAVQPVSYIWLKHDPRQRSVIEP